MAAKRGLTPRVQSRKETAADDTMTMRAQSDMVPDRPVMNRPIPKGPRAEDVFRARELRKERLIVWLTANGPTGSVVRSNRLFSFHSTKFSRKHSGRAGAQK